MGSSVISPDLFKNIAPFATWLFYFYVYSFVGWIIESTIVSVEQRRLVNRGFLRSPFLPLYGSGALVMLLVCLPVDDSPMLVYLFGLAASTVLEYLTGAGMEALFHMRYWDYSGQKFNLKGRICLTSSLFWGVLALFLTYVLHIPVVALNDWLTGRHAAFYYILLALLTMLFICDAICSFRSALDVRKILERVTVIRQELAELQEELSAKKDQLSEEAAKRRERLLNRIEELKEEKRLSLAIERLGWFRRNLLAAHPNASSRHFRESLQELQSRLRRRISKTQFKEDEENRDE